MNKISWGSGKIDNAYVLIILGMAVLGGFISIAIMTALSQEPEPTHWTENIYYEGMIPPDPDYIPAVRDDPDIRAAVRKHQIRLRDTGPGFYDGDIDGRIGGRSRDAYGDYVIWFMGRPVDEGF